MSSLLFHQTDHEKKSFDPFLNALLLLGLSFGSVPIEDGDDMACGRQVHT
jgi:hypothetical protein